MGVWLPARSEVDFIRTNRTRAHTLSVLATLPSRPLEQQSDWDAHARFMDELEAAGVVDLGGPLEGTFDVLLIMRSDSADEVASRLAADPWTGLDLLLMEQIMPWTLRLGALPAPDKTIALDEPL